MRSACRPDPEAVPEGPTGRHGAAAHNGEETFEGLLMDDLV